MYIYIYILYDIKLNKDVTQIFIGNILAVLR